LIFLLEHPLDAAMTHAVAKKGLNPRRGPDPARAAAEKEALAEDLDRLVRAESSDA
jgi:hypothetical protein